MTARTRWMIWLGITAALFVFLFAIKSILLPFVVGIMSAYFLDPAADRLEKVGFSRLGATTSITVLFFIAIGTTGFFLIPVIFTQLSELVTHLPTYVTKLQGAIQPQIEALLGQLEPGLAKAAAGTAKTMSGSLFSWIADASAGVLQSSFALLNALSLLLITPIVTFYLLRDWDVIVAKIDRLLPRAYEHTIREQVGLIDKALAGFVRGQLSVCLILIVYYAVILTILKLNYALLIAVLGGVLILIPYVGTLVTAMIALGVAYFQFGLTTPLAVAASVLWLGQVLESNVLTPKMVGDRVGLHPVWLIFGMLAGAALFGFVGVFLAVPVTAIIGVLVRFAVGQYLASSLYSTNGTKA